MITIRDEIANDIPAREALLDRCLGERRTAKSSERLREGRLPAQGLALTAERDGEVLATVRLWHVEANGVPALLLGPLARGELDGLLLTSSEGVRNLECMLGAEGLVALRAVTVFATHPRIVAQARAAGFERVVETPAGDDGLMQALESHFA